jgi:predicted enzyme involved in methoxymalonyl-ACP biosynthesis
MSGRVIGYGVETSLIATIVAEARASGASAVTGELIPTKKNAPARDFYERHFFSREGEDESGVTRWRYDLSSSSLQPPPWVHLERRRREEA